MNYVLGQDLPGLDIPEPGFTTAISDVTYVAPGGVIAPGQGSTSKDKEVVTITESGVQVTKEKLKEPPSLLQPMLWVAGSLLAWEFLT